MLGTSPVELVLTIGARTFRLAWITAVACGIFVLTHTDDPASRAVAWIWIVGAVSGTVLLHLAQRAVARAARPKAASTA